MEVECSNYIHGGGKVHVMHESESDFDTQPIAAPDSYPRFETGKVLAVWGCYLELRVVD